MKTEIWIYIYKKPTDSKKICALCIKPLAETSRKYFILFGEKNKKFSYLKKKNYNCLKKLIWWDVKNLCTRYKKAIFTWKTNSYFLQMKNFLILFKKLTIFGKHFIIDVFDRVLNTPYHFFHVLAKLRKINTIVVINISLLIP